MFKINVGIIIFLCSISIFAKTKDRKVIYSVFNESRVDNLRFKTQLVVFNNRDYVIKTNGNFSGFCQESKVGKFLGQFTKKQMKEFESHILITHKICSKSRRCTKHMDSTSLDHWRVRDLKNKKNWMIHSSVKMPSLISHIRKIFVHYRKRPLKTLEMQIEKIRRNKITVVFKVASEKNFKISTKRDNFFLVKRGELLPLDKKAIVSLTKLDFTGSINKKVIIDLKEKITKDMSYLVFDNSADSHHFDVDATVFTPCVSLF